MFQFFLIYAGLPLWIVQLIAVSALNIHSRQGRRSAAWLATTIAGVFTVLMTPVARLELMNRSRFDVEPSNIPHPFYIAQVLLLLACAVNVTVLMKRSDQ